MGRLTAVPPFRAEFGITVRYHVPAVAALPEPKVVVIEPGMEALYPGAAHLHAERRRDSLRRDAYGKDMECVRSWREKLRDRYPGCRIVTPGRSHRGPVRRFVPEPHVPQGVDRLPVDVGVCPRRRLPDDDTPANKAWGMRVRNWDGWPGLTDRLAAEGLDVFAAGREETSDTRCVPHAAAWDFARPLDATIEAMRSAELVIATDAGLAHLAVLCGAPLLLVTAGDYPAPGYRWPVRWEEYYVEPNHTSAPVEQVDGWEDVDRVVERAMAMMRVTA